MRVLKRLSRIQSDGTSWIDNRTSSHRVSKPSASSPRKVTPRSAKSKKCESPGPFGMSVEHPLALVESVHDLEVFFQLRRDCEPRSSAQGVLDKFRLGSGHHASQGRPGTFIRRLIARTIAQQTSKTSRGGTPAPYQYALQTKWGCECVAHGADVDRVEATTYRRVRGRSRCISTLFRPCFAACHAAGAWKRDGWCASPPTRSIVPFHARLRKTSGAIPR